MTQLLAVLFAAAVLTSFAVTLLAWRAGVLDLPNERSNHVRPTPRSGGLGICAGIGAGVLVAGFMGLSAPGLAGLIVIIGLFCALGLVDDLLTPDERIKSLVFIALCAGLVWLTGPVTWMRLTQTIGVVIPYGLGFAGSVLFAFTVINAVNFMDGSDGMMTGVMIPASIGLGLSGFVAGASDASLIAFALTGGLIGFSALNKAPARVFAGDAGSLCVGAAYCVAALMIAGQGLPSALWLAPMFVLVFLADVLLTLLRRLRAGRLSLRAHREHAYQRLIAAGWSHNQVALVYGALSVCIGVSALAFVQYFEDYIPALFALWVIGLTVCYRLVERLKN